MAERYMRYVKSIPAGVETTIFTAPDDGGSPVAAADSVIIGFLVASTSSLAGTLTATITGYHDAVVTKLLDTIPLPANTSIDIMPGKMVLQHGLNNASPQVLTGDILKITSTQTCDVTLSTVERV